VTNQTGACSCGTRCKTTISLPDLRHDIVYDIIVTYRALLPLWLVELLTGASQERGGVVDAALRRRAESGLWLMFHGCGSGAVADHSVAAAGACCCRRHSAGGGAGRACMPPCRCFGCRSTASSASLVTSEGKAQCGLPLTCAWELQTESRAGEHVTAMGHARAEGHMQNHLNSEAHRCCRRSAHAERKARGAAPPTVARASAGDAPPRPPPPCGTPR